MDYNFITPEFNLSMILMDLDKPIKITFSTYDLDMTLFFYEFYDPNIQYDIWYWFSIRNMSLPNNVHLHQLNNNHCKFWYIETKSFIRFILTSTNITYQMVHDCLQSICSFTCKKSSSCKSIEYNNYFKQFFDIFGIEMDLNMFNLLKDKLLFNIPNKLNGIERWLSTRNSLIIDSNNVNLTYLPNINKKILIRTEIPPNFSSIVCYYRLDYKSIKNLLIKIKYSKLFHYKLYYSNDSILISSNNFSFNHKMNYELGIIIKK